MSEEHPYKIPVPGRTGTWTQTAGGRKFFPLDPRPEDFVGAEREIAEQLAKKVRFAGAMPGQFYGNAEHCVLVSLRAEQLAAQARSRKLSNLCARQALLHDGSDAYLVDVPRPIKYEVPCMLDGWRPVEKKVLAAIYAAFGISPTDESTRIVEQADREVLLKECQTLLVHPEWSSMTGYEPAPQIVRALEWRDAMQLWLDRLEEIR
jgi:hypothetical protein